MQAGMHACTMHYQYQNKIIPIALVTKIEMSDFYRCSVIMRDTTVVGVAGGDFAQLRRHASRRHESTINTQYQKQKIPIPLVTKVEMSDFYRCSVIMRDTTVGGLGGWDELAEEASRPAAMHAPCIYTQYQKQEKNPFALVEVEMSNFYRCSVIMKRNSTQAVRRSSEGRVRRHIFSRRMPWGTDRGPSWTHLLPHTTLWYCFNFKRLWDESKTSYDHTYHAVYEYHAVEKGGWRWEINPVASTSLMECKIIGTLDFHLRVKKPLTTLKHWESKHILWNTFRGVCFILDLNDEVKTAFGPEKPAHCISPEYLFRFITQFQINFSNSLHDEIIFLADVQQHSTVGCKSLLQGGLHIYHTLLKRKALEVLEIMAQDCGNTKDTTFTLYRIFNFKVDFSDVNLATLVHSFVYIIYGTLLFCTIQFQIFSREFKGYTESLLENQGSETILVNGYSTLFSLSLLLTLANCLL
jgi:hypothetical protein